MVDTELETGAAPHTEGEDEGEDSPMDNRNVRYVFTPSAEQPLPLFIESIGMQSEQERVSREEGYPFYHWIQTMEGEGRISFEDKEIPVSLGGGILLLPNVPHTYQASGGRWGTLYLTFGGPLVQETMTHLGLHRSAFYRIETGTPLEGLLESMLAGMEGIPDLSGLQKSAELYRFLTVLKQFGQANNKSSVTDNMSRLKPLLDWLETRYSDPEIGLSEMSEVLGVTARRLGTLFRETFGLTPYAYLILLRVRKSKELLLSPTQLSVKTVAARVGFRDASHFVATFRRSVGLTPERFRKLN